MLDNAFFTSHTVDDFLEDSVDFYVMKFLKVHDESPAFILKKIAQIMSKIWQTVKGKQKGQENNSEFVVLNILKLREQTVVLFGKANATCLYKRRVNFLAKIIKGFQNAKYHLKTIEHDLSKEKEVLYGETYLRFLTEKGKVKKRAREISKEIQSKTKARRPEVTNRPFVKGPHVGIDIVGADCLHGCRNKTVKLTTCAVKLQDFKETKII